MVGDPHGERVAGSPRLVLGEELGDVADLGREGRRAVGPGRLVGQQMRVVLHARAAAGDVDGDRLEALVGRDRRLGERLGLLLLAGVELERAAAARLPRRVDLPALRAQDPHRGRVHVAEEDALDAALHERDAAARRTRGRGHLGEAGDRRAPLHRRGQLQQGAQLGHAIEVRAEPLADAQALLEREHRDHRPQPGGVGEQREDRLAVEPLVPRARRVALHLRARLEDELVVLDAGRAGGDARHAAEAAVEVRAHLRRGLAALLVADAHEHDAPARRVHLVLEDRVARARGQAEPAVDAVRDQVGIGRAVLVPRPRGGARHLVRFLPRRCPGGRSARDRSAP